ncbi:MAG: sigma factor-like helix-turn-helix DNA-binding protein [Chthoniobacterales bacterium]
MDTMFMTAETPAVAPSKSQAIASAIEALPSRIRDIAIMRGLGYKHHEIARHMGMTPQAVSIMLQRHRAKIKELGVRTEHWELSTRAANVLGRLRVTTREESRAKHVAGKLRGQRNCGEKTILEIERWLAEETDG